MTLHLTDSSFGQAAQVRAAQAQARATVANLLTQQLAAQQQQQQQQRNTQARDAALNSALNSAIHRAAANGTNPNAVAQQQLTMAAAAQLVQQYQAQQIEGARRAQVIKQAQAMAMQQQQQFLGQQPSMQALLKQAQLQDTLAAAANGQRGQAMGGYPFSQVQQAQAHAHAQQQAQAQMQAQHVQQLQAQQLQARQMAILANLSPAQIQALSSNPALAQMLLQARSGAQQQQQQLTSEAPDVAAMQASLRLRQQQQQQQQGFMQVPPSDNTSPASSNPGSPPNGSNMNKEQRRMALACVALQLAHSGLSVDQAIGSGIMGGMSVVDVRFIVEVYNAEIARMKDAKGAPEGGQAAPAFGGEAGGQSAVSHHLRQLQQQNGASHHGSTASPAPSSYAGSDAGNSAPSRSRGGSVVGSAADLHSDPYGEDGTQPPFNAFSYGFFGETGGGGEGELLGELEGDHAWIHDAAHPPPDAWSPPKGIEKEASNDDLKSDDVAERLANLDLGYGFF